LLFIPPFWILYQWFRESAYYDQLSQYNDDD
jgi:hypothetical protein